MSHRASNGWNWTLLGLETVHSTQIFISRDVDGDTSLDHFSWVQISLRRSFVWISLVLENEFEAAGINHLPYSSVWTQSVEDQVWILFFGCFFFLLKLSGDKLYLPCSSVWTQSVGGSSLNSFFLVALLFAQTLNELSGDKLYLPCSSVWTQSVPWRIKFAPTSSSFFLLAALTLLGTMMLPFNPYLVGGVGSSSIIVNMLDDQITFSWHRCRQAHGFPSSMSPRSRPELSRQCHCQRH